MSESKPTCIQSYKNCFQWTNIILSLVAAILGMAACASYSKKASTMMNVPYMIRPSYTWTGTDDAVLVGKSYFGLSGFTSWSGTSPNLVRLTFDYSNTYDLVKCDTDDYLGVGISTDTGAAGLTYGCKMLKTCATVGKVSMAFTCLGFLTALITMIFSNMRRASDGWTKKMFSVLFSFLSMLCSLIAFLSFGACMQYIPQAYTPQQDQEPPASCGSSCSSSATGSASVIYPGPGASMAMTSVIFFTVVFALSVAIPASDDALHAAKENTDNAV